MVARLPQTVHFVIAGVLSGFAMIHAAAAEQSVNLSTLPEQEIRILVLGDSLSSGYGLQGDGWVELVNQAFSDAGKPITVVNDSISGDTTAGGVARIAGSVERTGLTG